MKGKVKKKKPTLNTHKYIFEREWEEPELDSSQPVSVRNK